MKVSKQARRDAKQLFTSCKVNGLLDENRVRRAVVAVIARKPRGYVAILSHLHRLVRLDLERRTGRVESAVAAPEGCPRNRHWGHNQAQGHRNVRLSPAYGRPEADRADRPDA